MKFAVKALLKILKSWAAIAVLVSFCLLSFYLGELHHDMNLFAASGGVMTIFGLLSLIRFTTIDKFLNQEAIIARSTGITGAPLRPGESERIQKRTLEAARMRIKAELSYELAGVFLTIIGTLIWAYGEYVPLFKLRI